MITNFILNSNNILSNNNIYDKYINEQNNIINIFKKQLNNNIIKAVKTKITNFNLIINNALFTLWNSSWRLGAIHAEQEIQYNFSSSRENIIEFSKKDEKKLKQLIEARSKFDDVYKNPDGTYNLREYLKDTNRRGSYTKEQQEEYIKEIESKKIDLENNIQNKITLLQTNNKENISVNNKNNSNNNTTPKLKDELEKAELAKDLKKKQQDDYAKNKPNRDEINERIQLANRKKRQENLLNRNTSKRISKKREEVIRAIEEKRQTEARRSLDAGVPLLQQTEFGKAYLEQRINVLSNNINNSYRELLGYQKNEDIKGIIPDYLKSDKSNKDIDLVNKLNAMTLNSESTSANTYEQQINTITKIVEENKDSYSYTETPEAKQIAEELNRKQIELDSPRTPDSIKIRLANQIKVLELRYDKLIKESKNNIILTQRDKSKLPDLENKSTYTLKELYQFRRELVNKLKKIKDNNNKIQKIAITELGYAYNLGRLQYFSDNNIKYVKWNNDIENLNRNAPKTYLKNYENIYNKMSPKEKSTKSFEMLGVVCPICQERAERNNGKGKGIYKLVEVLNNPQLGIPQHPFCACFFTAVNRDIEDDDEENNDNKNNQPFNNNTAAWATGGTIAILGSALMYTIFKRTLKRNIRNIVKPPSVTKLITSVNKINNNNNLSKTVKKNITSNLVNNNIEPLINNVVSNEPIPLLNNLFNENKEQILESLIDNTSILLPLLPLNIPNKLEDGQILPEQKELIKKALSAPSVYSQNNINKTINDNIVESIKTNKTVDNNNPDSSPTLKQQVDLINNRLNDYISYSKNNLTNLENKKLINQFIKDTVLVQSTINNIENTTSELYANYRTLFKLREEAIDKALNELNNIDLPNNITKEELINNNSTINSLNNTIIEAEDRLRKNILLTTGDNSYSSQLKYIEEQLLSNPELKLEYLNRSKVIINNSINKISNKGLTDIEKELNKLDLVINENNINLNKYRQLMIDLEVINYQLLEQSKLINKNLINLDLDFIINNSKEQKVVGDSKFLLDYKKGIKKLQTKLFILTNMLINKKT